MGESRVECTHRIISILLPKNAIFNLISEMLDINIVQDYVNVMQRKVVQCGHSATGKRTSEKAQGTDVRKTRLCNRDSLRAPVFPRRVRYGGSQRAVSPNATQRRTNYYGNCPALCREHGLMSHEATRGYNILSTYLVKGQRERKRNALVFSP